MLKKECCLNEDRSRLWTPWSNDPYKNKNIEQQNTRRTTRHNRHSEYTIFICVFGLLFYLRFLNMISPRNVELPKKWYIRTYIHFLYVWIAVSFIANISRDHWTVILYKTYWTVLSIQKYRTYIHINENGSFNCINDIYNKYQCSTNVFLHLFIWNKRVFWQKHPLSDRL